MMDKSEGNQQTKCGAKLDKQIYEKFTDFVEEKHGKTRGVIGQELNEAMKRHMGISELDKIHREIEMVRADIAELREG